MDYELIPLNEKDPAYDRTPFLSYVREKDRVRRETDPVVGDSVHFWDGAACRAAIITQDDLTTWSLSFLMPGETSWRPVREVHHDEDRGEHTWHWPEAS